MGRALEYHSKEGGFAPIEERFFFSICLNLSLLKTAVSRTHLDVLQRDISIDIGNPMDVGLRHLTRLQKMGDVHPIDRGVLPGNPPFQANCNATRKKNHLNRPGILNDFTIKHLKDAVVLLTGVEM